MKKRYPVSALVLSVAGYLAIGGFEGYSDHVYIPVPGDNPTAGFGHMDARMDVGSYITEEQAVKWLADDTIEAQNTIKQCVKVPLSQAEFDAYVSFAFNVGQKNFCNSTLVKKLNAGQYSQACEELKRWVYSGGVKYKGLETRRKAEALMCQNDQYPVTPEWLERFEHVFMEISK